MHKESYSLTGTDIYNFFDGKIKILIFSEIQHYDNLEQLLNPYGRVIILFERKQNVGHWCALFYGDPNSKQKDQVFFFDPYAIKPENELKFSSGMNKYLNQRRNTLLRLFNGRTIKYNPVALQKWKNGINTCGRHCLGRISCNHLDSYEYAKLIKSQTDDPDKFITDVTNKFLFK